MLLPKRVKHRKWHKGRSRKRVVETRGLTVSFGEYGLKAIESAYISSRQIEAVRKMISNFTKRRGRLWIRIFPDKPITKRPPETTMGGGKGSVEYYVFPVRPGRILFELGGVEEGVAREAFRLAGHKLPCKTTLITRR